MKNKRVWSGAGFLGLTVQRSWLYKEESHRQRTLRCGQEREAMWEDNEGHRGLLGTSM